MSLTDIVSVSISRDSTTVSRQGFGTLLFLGKHKAFTEKVKAYRSLAEVSEDGFLTSDPEYIAAQKYFSQENHPTELKIGRRHGDDVELNVELVQNSSAYRVVINGVTITYTSDASATSGEITAGLAAAIDASSEGTVVNAIDNMDGTITVTPVVPATNYTLTVPSTSSTRLSASVVADDTLVETLEAIQLVDDDWYAVACYDHVKASALLIAAWVETQKKVYFLSSSDSDLITTATTDVATALKDLNYNRSVVLYHDEADTSFPEVAWLGRCLGRDPGSITWKFKTLVGINPVTLSTTQANNVKGKNGNIYTRIAGVDMTSEGKVASGEFIDIIHGIDWLEARIAENVFAVLVNNEKIPYTDGGVSQIKAAISGPLNTAIARGVLAADPEPTITAPRVSEVDSADKTARTLTNVSFKATLAGAVHFVEITGEVTV